MRKLIIGALVALAMSVPVLADPLLHMDTENGIIDVTGYEVHERKGKNYLYVIYEWENTTDKTDYASGYAFSAFQNGTSLRAGMPVDEPEGCKSRVTEIQPGYTCKYYDCFTLEDFSPVDIDLHLTSNKNENAIVTIDPSMSGAPAPVTEEIKTETGETVTMADLLARIEDLERRVEELENR